MIAKQQIIHDLKKEQKPSCIKGCYTVKLSGSVTAIERIYYDY